MPQTSTVKQTRRRGVSDPYTRRTTINLSGPQYEAVARRAKKRGTTVSTEIRQAVRHMLDEDAPPRGIVLEGPFPGMPSTTEGASKLLLIDESNVGRLYTVDDDGQPVGEPLQTMAVRVDPETGWPVFQLDF